MEAEWLKLPTFPVRRVTLRTCRNTFPVTWLTMSRRARHPRVHRGPAFDKWRVEAERLKLCQRLAGSRGSPHAGLSLRPTR